MKNISNQSEQIDIPVISLWLPWALWVIWGWKPIETRLHKRFAKLSGKTVGIHAAKKWDPEWRTAMEHLASYQISETTRAYGRWIAKGRESGILGTAFVQESRELKSEDSKNALIDCSGTVRQGLILNDVKPCQIIHVPGRQGIFRYRGPIIYTQKY